jgi:hypothetical protein
MAMQAAHAIVAMVEYLIALFLYDAQQLRNAAS